MRVLVLGFEPFGGETINPSWEVAQRLDGVAGAAIEAAVLPVHAQQVRSTLDDALARVEPDLVLGLGQAGGRPQITPERIGINLMQYRDDEQPRSEPIVPGGPDGYFTTLHLGRMVEAMRCCGVPAAISNSAGTFICNELIYLLGHRSAFSARPLPFSFLHLPYLPEQVLDKPAAPSMALETMLRGVSAALRAAVEALAATV